MDLNKQSICITLPAVVLLLINCRWQNKNQISFVIYSLCKGLKRKIKSSCNWCGPDSTSLSCTQVSRFLTKATQQQHQIRDQESEASVLPSYGTWQAAALSARRVRGLPERQRIGGKERRRGWRSLVDSPEKVSGELLPVDWMGGA